MQYLHTPKKLNKQVPERSHRVKKWSRLNLKSWEFPKSSPLFFRGGMLDIRSPVDWMIKKAIKRRIEPFLK